MDENGERPTQLGGSLDRSVSTVRARVVDPSDAVTGMAFLFGALGAIVGVAAALIVSGEFNLWLVGYCLLAGLAGGSAGVVTGGMVGAVFAVVRGVPNRPEISEARDVPSFANKT